MTMPAVTFYAMAVWLLCGGLTHHWWWQLLCISITTYLMVELNNINALIRIFSRMVSSTFLALLCSACFIFPALPETVMLTCMTAFILLLLLRLSLSRRGVDSLYPCALLPPTDLATDDDPHDVTVLAHLDGIIIRTADSLLVLYPMDYLPERLFSHHESFHGTDGL